MERFELDTVLPVSKDVAFLWHRQPAAFSRLAPPWESVKVTQPMACLAKGEQMTMWVAPLGVGLFSWIRLPWVAKITDYQENECFEDTQLLGPFAYWRHRHEFVSEGPHQCRVLDRISYALPGGFLGKWLGGAMVRRKIQHMFQYRQDVLVGDISQIAATPHISPIMRVSDPSGSVNTGVEPMKVLITGATGLVGTALCEYLKNAGHEPIAISRRAPANSKDMIYWNPRQGYIDVESLEGADMVVHLAGENIASGRWSRAKKEKLWNSRVEGTRILCEALANLNNKPKALISGSAIGFYGNRGDAILTESSVPGDTFLADLCVKWEAQTSIAKDVGIRVVNLRTGIVMSPKGGALSKMLLPFLLGGGGMMGNGNQYMSWIDLDDEVGAIYHCMQNDSVEGPVNLTAPNPVTNREFTQTMGRVLQRPTLAPPAPPFALRLILGEMADALLLDSTRVEPKVLEDTGYPFRYQTLEFCLRHQLGKGEARSAS